MEEVFVLEKQPLPFTSSEENTQENTDDHLDDQFENNQISVEPKVTHIGRYLHVVFVLISLVVCVYLFVYFLPVIMDEPGENWTTYVQRCCTYRDKMRKCAMYDECLPYFTTWVDSINKSIKNVQNNCCFWYTQFNNYRLKALPYCNPSCLVNYFFK